MSRSAFWLLLGAMGCGGAPAVPAVPKADPSLASAGEADPIAGLGPVEDSALVLKALRGNAAEPGRAEGVSKAFQQQVRYADTRRRMGEWPDAVRALAGAMALVRTGEAERLPLAASTRNALAGFADAFARAGREGEALGCYLWLSRPGDPGFSDSAAAHERALETWMQEAIEEHPSSWDSALARARVHAWYPSMRAREEAETALSNWISVLRAAGSRLGRGSAGELRALQNGMRDVGPELAALYLRDGDARGAAAALERADKTNGREVAAGLRAYAEAPTEAHTLPLLALVAPQENNEPAARALYGRVALSTSFVRLLMPLSATNTQRPTFALTVAALDGFRMAYVASALPRPSAPRKDARAAAALMLQEVATRELGAEDIARAERTLNDVDALLHEGEPDLDDSGALRMLTYLRASARALDGDFKGAESLLAALLPIGSKEPGTLEYASALEGMRRDSEAQAFLRGRDAKREGRESLFLQNNALRLQTLSATTDVELGKVRAAWQALCTPPAKDASDRVRVLRCGSILAAMGLPAGKVPTAELGAAGAESDARMVAHESAAADLFRGTPEGMITVRGALESGVTPAELVYPALWTQSALPAGHPDRAWLSSHVFAPAELDPRWRGRVASFARTGDLNALRAAAAGKLEQAEADFYEGLAKHRLGDHSGAKASWNRVLDARPVGLQEYEFAIWFLRLRP